MALTIVAAVATTLARKGIVREKNRSASASCSSQLFSLHSPAAGSAADSAAGAGAAAAAAAAAAADAADAAVGGGGAVMRTWRRLLWRAADRIEGHGKALRPRGRHTQRRRCHRARVRLA